MFPNLFGSASIFAVSRHLDRLSDIVAFVVCRSVFFPKEPISISSRTSFQPTCSRYPSENLRGKTTNRRDPVPPSVLKDYPTYAGLFPLTGGIRSLKEENLGQKDSRIIRKTHGCLVVHHHPGVFALSNVPRQLPALP